MTKTATLTQDVNEMILISSNNIILDLNGHSIIGPGSYPGSGCGIWLSGRTGVTIKNGEVKNWYWGIRLLSYSDSNTISNNVVANNFFGIELQSSSSNTISNNVVTSNNNVGIHLSGSSFNTISNNDVTSNNNVGINLVLGSSSNKIYYNNIISNYKQAFHDASSAGNHWHEPTDFEGNYWSNYPGLDDGSGAQKHAIAGDGIGDTNIPWPSAGYDNYPFVEENRWMLPTGMITQVGHDVRVSDPDSGVEVKYDEVTKEGKTEILTSDTGPEPPAQLEVKSPFIIVKKTAKLKEDTYVTLEIPYDPAKVKYEEKLKVERYLEPDDTWTEVPTEVDTEACLALGKLSAKDFGSIFVLMEPAIIPATIDIDPDTLNLKSNGEFLTVYIELPEGYSVTAIDTSTVQLEDIHAIQDPAYGFVIAPIIDYDGDGILECMVKFDRGLVRDTQTDLNDYEEGSTVYDLVLTLTGTVDSVSFEGSDTIKVIRK